MEVRSTYAIILSGTPHEVLEVKNLLHNNNLESKVEYHDMKGGTIITLNMSVATFEDWKEINRIVKAFANDGEYYNGRV